MMLGAGGFSFWLAGRDHMREEHLRLLLIIAGISSLALAAALVFLNRRMSLIITPQGIRVPAMDPDTIPWYMIRSAIPLRSSFDTQLRLELAPGYHPLANRTALFRGSERLAARDGISEWTVECADFHLSTARIADLITECIAMEASERSRRIANLPKRPIHLL